MSTKPFYVAGQWRTGEGTLDVHSPYDDSVVATLGVPTDADVEDAMVAAVETFKESRHLPTYARAEALMHISTRIAERTDQRTGLPVHSLIFVSKRTRGSSGVVRFWVGWFANCER